MSENPYINKTETAERLLHKIELLFPPQPLSVPAGITFAQLLVGSSVKTPDVKEGTVNEMNEAYVAALSREEEIEISQLEFSAVMATESTVAALKENKAIDNSWRLASPVELMMFTTTYPHYMNESPLVALGQTAEIHYPLAVTKTGENNLEISARIAGIGQLGTRILIVRQTDFDNHNDVETNLTPETNVVKLFEVMKLPLPFDSKQMKCLAVVENLAPEQKIEVFSALAALLTTEDREILTGLENVNELIGVSGVEIQALAGDVVFDKIINVVIMARLKNTPLSTDTNESGLLYSLTKDQQARLQTAIAVLPQSQKQEVWQLLAESEFLNAPIINVREKAKIVFSAVNSILKYFEKNPSPELLSPDDFVVIQTERNKINNLIGTMRNLKFV